MLRPMRRATRTKLALAVVAAVTFLLIFVQPSSDEKAAREAFVRAARALDHQAGESAESRESRLRRELAELLAPDVRLALPGGEELVGREAVVSRALAMSRDRRAVAAFKEIRSARVGRSRVRVAFEVVLSDSQAGDLHARPRAGEAELVRGDQGWRVQRVEVGAESREEPEARP